MSNLNVISYVKKEVVACRACLATGTAELYNLHDNDLVEVFTDLSGFPVSITDSFPQLICNMCLLMLRKLLVFRRRCQLAVNMLQQMVAHDVEITTESLATLEHKYTHSLMKSDTTIVSIDSTTGSTAGDTLDDIHSEIVAADKDHHAFVLMQDNGYYVDGNKESKPEFVQIINDADIHVQFEIDVVGGPVYDEHDHSQLNIGQTIIKDEKSDSDIDIEVDIMGSLDKDEYYDVSNTDSEFFFKHLEENRKLFSPGVLNEENMNKKEILSKGNETIVCSCDICDYTTSNEKTLVAHLKAHAALKRFACDMCPFITVHKIELITHIKESHKSLSFNTGEKSFSCDSYQRDLKRRDSKNNKKIHTSENTYFCDVCAKSFTQKYSLVTHKIVHSSVKPYICDVCSKRFHRKCTLIIHKRLHTGEKPYSCHVCHKHFSDRSNLKKHEKKHTGERKFSCNVCAKKFISKINLTVHQRSHTGERPYTCDVCHNNFSDKSVLCRHKKIHMGKKPYPCDVCHKDFIRKTHLDAHKKIHK